MLIQVNTDSSIEGDKALGQEAESIVRGVLGHLSEHVTRVEVHLSDEDSNKKVGPDAKRCLLEARIAGRQPIAVSHQATTLGQAIDGAAKKLQHSLESVLGRRDNR